MAETIKGINVVIGSDTMGLSAALSDVNRQSRNIQGELRQVERLLRLDPSNTQLVAQQQRLLGDAVANSREKLDRLRAAQEQVNQQFARGEISEGQYRAFQREVVAAEQELRRLDDRLEQTGRTASNLGENLQKTGEKMTGVGKAMSVGVTTPIVAAAGLLAKGAADAETAQGKLQASLGLTAEEAEKLGDIARQVWKDGFGENIDEATAAITTVRQNMAGLADDELAKVTEGAMAVAQVFDEDVNAVAVAAGVAMKNFGISGQEALDIITVGYQKGGNYSGELLDTIREYSPQFASMGLSADQAMAMLIAGAQAGAWNLDKVGDAMKEFNIRAQDGSKTTAEGFAMIGLSADEMGAAIAKGGDDAQKAFMATVAALAAMDDPMQQNTAGVALFGTQWEDVRSQVIIAMTDGVAGLQDFKGATDEATKALQENNPGLALTKALREVQDAVGPALLPIADIINNTVVPGIKSLADWFNELSPAGQKTVLAIVGIVAAIGPLLMILGPIVSVVGSIVGAFGAFSAAIAGGATGIAILTTAFPILGTAFAVITGPIGIAIAAIAAFIAIGVALYKNWDEIKVTLSDTWNGIRETAFNVWDGIKNFFEENGKTILLLATGPAGWAVLLAQKLGISWDGIKETALNIWALIKLGISDIWNSITNSTSGAMSNLYNTVRSKLESVWEYVKSIPNQALQWGKNIIQGLINGIKSLHIPMPHFNFSVDYKSIAGVNFPAPSANVNWYGDGGIFTRPTVIGVGEKGPEAVVPLDKDGGFGDINLTFTGPITVRNDDDIVQVSNRLHGLVRSTQRGSGRR